MVHFFGIFAPALRKKAMPQQPFFSDDARPSRAEADADLLSGKIPPQPQHRLEDQASELSTTRFVSLLSPPYF
jgi:hypothetical protein